ncbi:hypothetical protein QBC39DRAFT_371571 [Podospora conica]|nr:hypothetical protein QBC39DRAFT_371571 [Schizothecium conicum]
MLVAAVETRAKGFVGLRLMLTSVWVCKGEEHDGLIQTCPPVRLSPVGHDDISCEPDGHQHGARHSASFAV